jgi:hypothetical protein
MALTGLFLCCLAAAPAAAQLPEPVQTVPDRQLFFLPLNGNLGSPFGYRWGRMHEGIDIEGWAHTEVHAALSGTVTRVGWLRNYDGFGLVVKLRHEGGIVTMYAHLDKAFLHGNPPALPGLGEWEADGPAALPREPSPSTDLSPSVG